MLEGAWTLEHTEVAGGDTPGTVTGRPGSMIFTSTHYSWVSARGNPLRPKLSENATDAERLAAFTPFIANAGTYTLNGSTLTKRVVVAKIPNNHNMTETSEVRFESDEVLWVTYQSLSNIDVTEKWVRAE